MIDVLVSAMYSYCKSKCLEPDNDAILNRVINQYKCRTEEFIEKFSHNEYKSFSILLKGGLIINKVFPEFGNHIYFEDLTGKSGNHFWNVFKNDNSSVLKYEPFIIGKSYLQSIPENGIVTIEYDRVYIHPMYLFAALLKFSAFEHNTESQSTEIKEFKDIIDEKYHSIIPSLFNLLGEHFPEYYDIDGKALSSKRFTKAILNSWYKILRIESITTINPTKTQKEQICSILLSKCRFVDNRLSTKTLFDNDGIEQSRNYVLLKKYNELKKAINTMKTK